MTDVTRWQPAPHDIEVVDIWPPGTFTTPARDAYDALARKRRIVPCQVKRDATGRVLVRYLSDIPAPWIHEELKEAKYNGKQITLSERA